MRTITRTIYGSKIQTSLLLNVPYTQELNTTLNERFDIESETELEDGKAPPIAYFCIGNGGHRILTGADGIPYTSPINHRASDAALFNHVPFVLREVNNDLTVIERQKYGLRRTETHDGVNYVAYYLKRFDTSATNVEMLHTRVVDGHPTTTPFEPSNGNLNPEQPEVPNDGVISTDGNYLSASAIIPIHFDEKDVEELVNVARVLYDNEARAVISEIGLCAGFDRTITASGSGGQFNYKEAIGVQIVTHVTGYYPVGLTNRGFELMIEAGATEPMLGEGSEG